MTSTRSCSLRTESGASMTLFSRKSSSPVFGTFSVSFISPSWSGFHVMTSCMPAHRGDDDRLRDHFAVRGNHLQGRRIPRAAASSRCVNGMRSGLPAIAKAGTSKRGQLDIGQPRLRADRHGENRHAAHAQARGGLRRRIAGVPVAVAQQHDRGELRVLLADLRERGVDVGPLGAGRFAGGKRLDRDVHPLLQLLPRGEIRRAAR